MAVQVTASTSSLSHLTDSAAKRSKKRKLELPHEARSSSKKRKHVDAAGGDLAQVGAEETLRRSSEKKRKKKAEDAEVVSEPAVNGEVVEVDVEQPDAEETHQPGSAKKRKKKSKDGKIAPKAAVYGDAAEEDVELPPASLQDTSKPEDSNEISTEYPFGTDFLESADPSCFYSTRISLCVPIPALSLSTARQSILSAHLAPLLLTYFPPAKGIILAFSDPILSAKPDFGINLPLRPPSEGAIPRDLPEEVMSRAADEFGSCWVWLTVTLLVFRPERGDKLHGWTNVTSSGLVGLISYNYFQTAVGKTRVPDSWTWTGPTREAKKTRGMKGRLRDEDSEHWSSQTMVTVEEDASREPRLLMSHLADGAGFFSDQSGERVSDTLEFRVVDTEMVPGNDRDKWSINIEGSLLDEEAERKVLEEERTKFERLQNRGKSATPGPDAVMSGGVGQSREGSEDVESPE